jgi:hypothetical protein
MLEARRCAACVFAAILVLVVASAHRAQAQEAQVHHGLYVRVAAGVSYFSDGASSDPIPPLGETIDGTLKGGAFSTQLAVGGSIMPGFVVGGALFFHHMPGPSATDGAAHIGTVTTSIGAIDFDPTRLTVIGPFADYYFNPASGLHVQAALGYGILSLGQGSYRGSGNQAVQDQSGGGLAGMLGGGYEWWVSSSWGVGVLGQFMFGLGSGEDSRGNKWQHHVLVPGLLLSATMN